MIIVPRSTPPGLELERRGGLSPSRGTRGWDSGTADEDRFAFHAPGFGTLERPARLSRCPAALQAESAAFTVDSLWKRSRPQRVRDLRAQLLIGTRGKPDAKYKTSSGKTLNPACSSASRMRRASTMSFWA